MMAIDHKFWDWFRTMECQLYDCESNQEPLFDRLATQLQAVNEHLSFEVGPKCDGKRELVISAGGIKDAFPAVVELVANAPVFIRWKVTAFRPRRSIINTIHFGGYSVSPNDVRFSLLHNKKTVGIHLFIPGYSDENSNMKQIGYLFLDDALGECDVESKVGLIKMFPTEPRLSALLSPLSELPKQFDQLIKQLG